jgi:uncharacterized SAM-binding protein YcdF (DUF218 family)
VKAVVLPPMGPLVLALIGLVVVRWKPRLGFALALAGVLALAALSMPIVSAGLVQALDRTPAFDASRTAGAQAIVVLSGGTRLYAAEYDSATLGSISLQRVRYAAWLAKRTGLPILASGGSVRGARPEALLMRDVLVHEFGVPVRFVETRSRNTHENAVLSAAILRAAGISRVILVGHSFDFPRSRKEFEAAGIDVVPAPIGIPRTDASEFGDFLPSARGLLQSYYACYEILANALFDITHALEDSGGVSGDSADTRATPRSSSPLPPGS